MGVCRLFEEKEYSMQIIKEGTNYNRQGNFRAKFIKQNNQLPKMYFPFERIHDFPYFCIQVIKADEDEKLVKNDYYYLSCTGKNWWVGKDFHLDSPPSHKAPSYKVCFIGINFGSTTQSADDFCKDC